MHPDAKVIRQKPFVIAFEKGDAFDDEINEKETERKDRGRCRLHVEAREHEGKVENNTGVDGHEDVREQIEFEAFSRLEDVENHVRHEDEHPAPGKPEASK